MMTNSEKPDNGVKKIFKNAHLLIVSSAFFITFCLVLWLLAIRHAHYYLLEFGEKDGTGNNSYR